MTRISAFLKKHPVLTYILTFAMPWGAELVLLSGRARCLLRAASRSTAGSSLAAALLARTCRGHGQAQSRVNLFAPTRERRPPSGCRTKLVSSVPATSLRQLYGIREIEYIAVIAPIRWPIRKASANSISFATVGMPP